MNIEFNKLEISKEELLQADRTNPYNVAALYVRVLCSYNNLNQNAFYDLLQVLLGEYQPLSGIAKQSILDRLMQNEKYEYIGKSYFIGANPSNDYTPSVPYTISVMDDPNFNQEGYKRLFLQSGGADSKRPIMVRLAKDGNYYLWSDSYMGLMTDIRSPESKNPWA